jgi:succinyl-CoA:acetate CoA-transferase
MDRMRAENLKTKIMSPSDAAGMIRHGMTLGTSGFTPAGHPKAIPLALAARIASMKEPFRINLMTGASVGDELDGALSRVNGVDRRLPYQTQSDLRRKINDGSINYMDMHLSHVQDQLRYGYLGPVDMAVVEAAGINEDGRVIPSTSVGNVPVFLEQASKVMIEICTAQPLELEGFHDIYQPKLPPEREPIPILRTGDRIGSCYYDVNPEKIAAIVYSDIPDSVGDFSMPDEASRLMAMNLISFLEFEIKQGRMTRHLRPLQSGVGATANAVLAGLLESPFEGLSFYSEVIQDAVLPLIDSGKLSVASATSLTLSAAGRKNLFDRLGHYRPHIILRPQEISNHPEVIRRLGVISMNTAIEVDLSGHVNSTHIMGTRMMNGIGGSGDFTRNASLSVFMTASTAKDGAISSIVPFVSHCDHTEHDVQIVITEQGVADLRGKTPLERARLLADHCAHPDYRDALKDYIKQYKEGRHTGHLMSEALSWHDRFLRNGSMR